jgi:signal peptidase II
LMGSSLIAQAVVGAVLLIGVVALYLLRFARSWRWVAVAMFVCVLDQGSKALVHPGIQHRRLSFLDGWLRITYAQNREQGFGGTFSYLLLTTAVMVVLMYFLYERLLKRGYRMSTVMELALALMIGGYLGILLDRIRLGFVVDFLEFGPASGFVYNIADLAVFLALTLLMVRVVQFAGDARARRNRAQTVTGWPRRQGS